MQSYHQIVEALKHSPQLPTAIHELNRFWEAEQERRVQFYNDIDEDSKSEFVEGQIIVHSPAKHIHNIAVVNLATLLNAFVNQNNSGVVCAEKALIKLTRNDFEPDLCFFGPQKAEGINEETLFYPAPDWICEVLSPSTQRLDRGIKMKDYALHGIGEYWIVDPVSASVEQYVLINDAYSLQVKLASSTLDSKVMDGFSIPVAAIFNQEENLAALKRILQ